MIEFEFEKQLLKIDTKPSIFVLILKGTDNYNILGCDCSDWVIDAVNDYNYAVVKYDKTDLVEFAKKHTNASNYVVLLSENMPLLTKTAFNNLVDYCVFKGVKACKFRGGAVFDVEYLKSNNNIYYDSVYSQNEDVFWVVETVEQRNYALDVLKSRIINFYINNGVDIKDFTNVLIEKNVDIERGVQIFSGNVLKGNTYIGKNVILKENNTITNSAVGGNSCIASSVIDNSTIGCDCIVMPYSHIDGCTIGNNVVVSGNVSLANRKIKDNKRV